MKYITYQQYVEYLQNNQLITVQDYTFEKLIEKNMNLEEIQEITGLSKEEIKKLEKI